VSYGPTPTGPGKQLSIEQAELLLGMQYHLGMKQGNVLMSPAPFMEYVVAVVAVYISD
jgi:hypothetical protein